MRPASATRQLPAAGCCCTAASDGRLSGPRDRETAHHAWWCRAVIGRLREILEIRDQAFRNRSPEILNDVYTEDCPCLEGDKNAIQELLDNDYHIVGGATSVRIREVNQVSERLWLVVADFRSASLRIEAEGNRLVREEPGGSDLFQFALSKPSESTEWLLGRATAYRDGSG